MYGIIQFANDARCEDTTVPILKPLISNTSKEINRCDGFHELFANVPSELISKASPVVLVIACNCYMFPHKTREPMKIHSNGSWHITHRLSLHSSGFHQVRCSSSTMPNLVSLLLGARMEVVNHVPTRRGTTDTTDNNKWKWTNVHVVSPPTV